jgi:Dockerin type I domain
MRTSPIRKLRTEQLENRALMAGDLSHNFLEPNDVNDDSRVSPVDALLVINTLNDIRSNSPSNSPGFHDVNDDSRVSPTDALTVINQLNASRDPNSSSSSGSTGTILNHIEAKLQSATTEATAKIEFEESSAEKELSIKVRDAAAIASYSVKLNDIALGELLTDAKGRGKLVFSVGDDNDSHQPWPANLPPLTVDTELIIGDIVRGKLGNNSDDSPSGGNGGGGSTGGGSSTGGSSSQSSGAWIATIPAVGSLTRKAEFETESEDGKTKSKLEVEIEGAATGATYSIKVGSFDMGQVVASSKGKAKVVWSTQPRDGELALPAGFPSISDSISVAIGDATAKFVRV